MEAFTEIFPLLVKFGVRNVVCSPGSRNAALLQEVDSFSELKKTVVIDERTAAFTALGMSLITKQPVALICTSGSALLNYAPALAEAYYQGVPVIVVSADRPYEWIDQDDSQTIRQANALANVVKASYDINGNENETDYLWYVNRILNEGMIKAVSGKHGPVHFNVHLNGKVSPMIPGGDVRKIDIIRTGSKPDMAIIRELAEIAYDKKIMVVAGFMCPDSRVQKACVLMNQLPNLCFMAETVSNLHLPCECYRIDTALFPLKTEMEEALAPDIVISLGGALISRKLKEFVRRNPPMFHWSFSNAENLVDCFQALTTKIECEASSFLKILARQILRLQERKNFSSDYKKSWCEWRVKSLKNIADVPWSDLKALSVVFENLPKNVNLFLSNGTSVRYGQIIPYKVTHATYSNRGVSGIEGSTSTAIGASLEYKGITCLVTGDMSFGYDLGGLSSGLADKRMRIIILDNNGGDIFRFIPATRQLSIRDKYLCAPHDMPVKALTEAFGWNYYFADSVESLISSLKTFFLSSEAPAILHISTRNVANNAEILTSFLN